jgi:LacI family transcriptional regulator
LIVPDISNPFFAELALEIERCAAAHGSLLLLGNSMQDDARQASYLAAFADQLVHRICIVGAGQLASEAEAPLTNAQIAGGPPNVVFIDRLPTGANGITVCVDNEQGAFVATRHLLDHGLTRIGMLAGPVGVSSADERERGWRRALLEAEIDPSTQVVVRSDFNRYAAHDAVGALWGRDDLPQAFFVQSDEQSIGVLRAAAQVGVAVPRDVAIVSFDGIRESAFTVPPLTTVRQPLQLIAETAYSLLEQTDDPGVPKSTMLPVSLVIRSSCGCGAATAHNMSLVENPRIPAE